MVDINQRIDQAAWALFTQRGYTQVTMDDIAAELGMSKKTIYAAIPGKEALLHRLVQARLQEAEAYTAEIVNNPDLSAYEKLRSLLAYGLSQLAMVQPVLLADVRRHAPDTWAMIEATRNRLINERVGVVIREGVARGELRDDLDPDVVQSVLYHSLRGVITGALPITDPLRFAQLLETTMLLLYSGLAKGESP